MTQQEISEETHTPLGTVKSRTRQAMKKLRLSLGTMYRQAPVQTMESYAAIAA
jgi:RNA polymerase sigma-70 factor (ECF subfamily)